MDFADVVDDKNWENFDDFMRNYDIQIEQDIQKSVEKREEYRNYLLNDRKLRDHVQRPTEDDLKKSRDTLYSGKVVAADGTLNRFPLLTGLRCRIGVITTSYKNDSIERVLFVSEREFAESSTKTPREFFDSIGRSSGISNLFLAGIMSYKERQIILQRPEEWKFIHGTLVPLELRVPRVGHGAFEACLELAKKLIDHKKCVGVISGSSDADFVGSGIVLNSGEYMFLDYVSNRISEEINEAVGNEEERKTLTELSNDYLSKIKVGVFRIGPKPYLFEAHEEYFDEAASLIIRDSMNQDFRGFPLLIDYADSMCKAMLGSNDFTGIIEHKMARIAGYSGYGYEISERRTRRR